MKRFALMKLLYFTTMLIVFSVSALLAWPQESMGLAWSSIYWLWSQASSLKGILVIGILLIVRLLWEIASR